MAIDVQLVVSLPRWDGVRVELKKIVTLPVVPRVTDEVYMPEGVFLPVGRVRFRADGRVALFFEDAWTLQYVYGGNVDDVVALLEEDGFARYSLWDPEPEPEPDEEPEPDPDADPELEPEPDPEPEPEPEPEPPAPSDPQDPEQDSEQDPEQQQP